MVLVSKLLFKMIPIYWVLFILLHCITVAHAQNWVGPYLIPEGYDSNAIPLPPSESNNVTNKLEIDITLTVNAFTLGEATSVCFGNSDSFSNSFHPQTLSTTIVLCLAWRDYRIQPLTNIQVPGVATPVTYTDVKLSSYSMLWTPSIYIRNAASASVVSSMRPLDYVQVWPEQQLLSHCSTLQVVTACKYDLRRFPFDYNYCDMEFADSKQHKKIDLT